MADEYANIRKDKMQEMKVTASVAAAKAVEAAEEVWLYDDWEDDDSEWMDRYDNDGPLMYAGPMVRGNRGAAGSARGGGGERKRVDGKGSIYTAKHARKVGGAALSQGGEPFQPACCGSGRVGSASN